MTTTKFKIADRPEHVDAAACRMEAGVVQFMNGDEATKSDGILHPVSMVARSPNPVNHWYWGKTVHDLSGVRFHKDTIVIDYCHDDTQVIGFLDKFNVGGSEGLQCTGAIVRQPGIAEKVVTNATNGVPYESSIYFDRDVLILEWVEDGASVEVNGFTFEGPGVVIREWMLRAVSVCPHGYDMNTETRFSHQSNPTVNVTYKEPTMADTNVPQGAIDKLTQEIEELKTKLAASSGEPEQPQDLPSALEKIKELETKLAAPKAEEGNQDLEAKLAATNEPADDDVDAKIEALEKKFEAKFAHAGSSSGESASGDGSGEGKEAPVKWRGLFKFARDQQQATSE